MPVRSRTCSMKSRQRFSHQAGCQAIRNSYSRRIWEGKYAKIKFLCDGENVLVLRLPVGFGSSYSEEPGAEILYHGKDRLWNESVLGWLRRMEEQQVKMAIQGLSNAETGDRALDAQRIFELANNAYSLCVSQNPVEKAKLLKMLFSNCSVDAASVTPTYRKPFAMIFERARLEEWSGREDSNLRPPGPEPGALPDCATPRMLAAVRCR